MGRHKENLGYWVRIASVAALTLLGLSRVNAQDIQYKSDPNADKNMTLLLKDWDPTPMLRAKSHETPRAKYYVIDMHNHVDDAARIDEQLPPEEVIKTMDATNVRTIVILTG